MASEVASEAEEFKRGRAIAYALRCLDCPSLQLKFEQETSLRAVYSGKDALVWLPTGFGKSLCYTPLPFAFNYKSGRIGGDCELSPIVVSPLMTDQAVNLRAKGVSSAIMTTACSRRVPDDLVAS